MNSLSNFDHCPNPVQAYLDHMTQYAVYHNVVNIFALDNSFRITLPNGNCNIKIEKNTISIRRMNFDYDNVSKYIVDTVDKAKQLIGILSGVCFEHGCTRKEADETAYLICQLLNQVNLNHS